MRLKMTVNGTEYVVDVEAEQEVRAVPAPIVIGGGPGSAPTPTTASVPGAAANAITAPLAGSVARILVKEGDKVDAGQVEIAIEYTLNHAFAASLDDLQVDTGRFLA